MGTGTKEDESSTGHVWAAGFHHFMAHSRLGHVLKLNEPFVSLIFQFFSGRSKPQILNQWIWGHDCIFCLNLLNFLLLKQCMLAVRSLLLLDTYLSLSLFFKFHEKIKKGILDMETGKQILRCKTWKSA
jgi:hypothetical protein